MFGPELQLKEVKFKFFSPSLPSRTYSRAKNERMRKGQRNLRKKAKEEKKAGRRLSKQGDAMKRVKVVKKKVTTRTFKVQIMACTDDDEAVGWTSATGS